MIASPTVKTLDSLAAQFAPSQVTLDAAALITYEVDAGMDRGKPSAVFFPESTADVSRMMAWAAATGTPLIARGAGTGLAGGAVAEQGGVLVVFARMNQVTAFNVAARTATVQAGVVNLAFDLLVREKGLYYPPDPSSGRSAVIGGNIGANAGGPHCFKYGVTTNYVTGMEVVLSSGRAVRLGHPAPDVPGYDLLGVMVGSEGTLGIVTHADVRLIRNAPGVKTMMVAFDTDEQAGEAVSAVIAAGLVPATLEMMDQRIMRMIEAYAPVGLPIDAGAGLIVEVDGYPAGLDEQMDEIAGILTQHGGYDLRMAQSEAERAQIWYGRKSAAGAVSRLAPAFYLVDVTVPRSTLAPVLAGVNQICDRYKLAVGHVFHAGDGNLHPIIPFDPRDVEERKRVLDACHEIVALCLEYNGSITGEHGVGIEKRAYMPMMYGGSELSAMLDVKRLLDPDNLLNPGKIFPEDVPGPKYVTPIALQEFVPQATAPQSDGPDGAVVLEPESAEEAAGLLAGLAQLGRKARIIGGAVVPTATPARADYWLSTKRLRGVRQLAPADLYVTAGAGTPLDELQSALAAHNMTVPLESPWPQATLGDILATNLNGPGRLRHGSVRDQVTAMTVALADGRVLRLGRPVVKNVAGYDLAKLFIGANGTLGLIVDVTLKLLPRPRAQHTLTLDVPSVDAGLAWIKRTAPHWFVTAAIVLAPTPNATTNDAYQLRITLEGLEADIQAELAELYAVLEDIAGDIVADGVSVEAGVALPGRTAPDAEAASAGAAWQAFLQDAPQEAMLVRVGVPSMQLGVFWSDLPQALHTQTRWCFDGGNHLAYACLNGDPALQARHLNTIRESARLVGGYAVVLQASTATDASSAVDRWGHQPDTLDLMRSLKQTWDPSGVLNPGEHLAG